MEWTGTKRYLMFSRLIQGMPTSTSLLSIKTFFWYFKNNSIEFYTPPSAAPYAGDMAEVINIPFSPGTIRIPPG